jgi:hypothetical protein
MPGPGPEARPCSWWLPAALRGGLPLSAPSRPVTQSSRWMVAAIANPSVVTTPVSLPPCWWASGIIVSASMVRIAPAAKARTKATVPGEECWNRPYPASEASPEITAIAIHIHKIRDFAQPPVTRPEVEEIDSGRLEMNDRGQVGGAHRPALEDRQADHHRLGDPVEHRAEHDGQRGAVRLAAISVLTVSPPEVVDQPVAAEEDRAAGEQARNRRPVTGGLADRLLHQVERDRADQHACAEGQDQPDHAQADAEAERDQGADHQRGSRQGSPAERCCHLPSRLRLPGPAGDRTGHWLRDLPGPAGQARLAHRHDVPFRHLKRSSSRNSGVPRRLPARSGVEIGRGVCAGTPSCPLPLIASSVIAA